ncbi:hypothetical protein CEP51_016328 [Fusarium floridanum]|uniref:Uncharacterized protein n=1 Tax=Fusarium floridanum TaxID=1325733 RepID=A0A428NSF8_9HYPO|nr:hypothetical protein CEP51_016328 [Fusarium floridanum]
MKSKEPSSIALDPSQTKGDKFTRNCPVHVRAISEGGKPPLYTPKPPHSCPNGYPAPSAIERPFPGHTTLHSLILRVSVNRLKPGRRDWGSPLVVNSCPQLQSAAARKKTAYTTKVRSLVLRWPASLTIVYKLRFGSLTLPSSLPSTLSRVHIYGRPTASLYTTPRALHLGPSWIRVALDTIPNCCRAGRKGITHLYVMFVTSLRAPVVALRSAHTPPSRSSV